MRSITYFYRVEYVNFRQGLDIRLAIADLTEAQVRMMKIYRRQADFVPGVSPAGR